MEYPTIIDAIRAIKSDIAVTIRGTDITWDDGNPTDITQEQIDAKLVELLAEYDTTQPLKLLREERDKKLKEEVDPKTCEAYNNGTQLSNEWKNYRQALLDMTLQTPTLDENGNLKAGLELDEIYWPTKPE